MNKLKYLSAAFIMMLACMNFTSCSDDDEEPNSGNSVFGNGKKLSAWYYNYNYNGREEYYYSFANPVWNGNMLTSFKCDYNEDLGVWDEYNITYLSDNEAQIADIDSYYGLSTFNIYLNEQGYAESMDLGGGYSIYDFTYNSDGQMTAWSWGNWYCNIYYSEEGDITQLVSNNGVYSFSYTNSTVTTPIENKGNIMLLSDWKVMDDYEYFYWFGIYGKAIKHLPVKVGDVTFDWTLDSEGYPVECERGEGTYTESRIYYFEWE